MKTRIISTGIFLEDDWFNSLSLKNKFIFIYFFTNAHIGMTGMYKISDRVIRTETGGNDKDIAEAKALFEKAGKVLFCDEWVYVVNAERHNPFKGEKNDAAKEKERSSVPQSVLTVFKDRVSKKDDRVSGADSAADTPNNHINNNINNKSSLESLRTFLTHFNEKSGKNYEITKSRAQELERRLKKYSMEQLMRASDSLLKSPYHTARDKRGNPNNTWYATPDFLLRNDEMVDRWLNAEALPVIKKTGLADLIK